METYTTKYGLITLYKNEIYIGGCYNKGIYWDEDSLIEVKQYINPNRNILEIGGHCGTSSIVYASYLLDDKKVFVYEPQKNMYNLLVKNITQNNLEHKIIPNNSGVFCYSGIGSMNEIDLDGGGGIVEKRYNEESHLQCNFGGICLGYNGEKVNLITIDDMRLDDIGFIHCDAQGAETFIFSKGLETIKKNRPVILYENNVIFGPNFYYTVCMSYPNYTQDGMFDIKKYCMEELHYSKCIDKFGGMDTLLIP